MQLAVQRVLPGEKCFRYALTDNHDTFRAIAVGVSKVAALEKGHSQCFKEARGDGPEPCAQILLAIFAGRAVDGEPKADVECISITPGNAETRRHVLHAWQSAHAALHILIE